MAYYICKRFASNAMKSKWSFNNISSVCIIGGGVAGLQSARALQRIGMKNIKIIESQNKFGGVWINNKYDNLGLQTPLKYYQFAEYLYKEHKLLNPSPLNRNASLKDFASSHVLNEYIYGYASKFNLFEYAQFNTQLQYLKKSYDTNTNEHYGWDVTTIQNDTGIEKTERFDFVVIATGNFSNKKPVCNDIENIKDFKADGGIALHSSEFASDCNEFKNKDNKLNVAVIGAGKSSHDIVLNGINTPELFNKPVYQIQRKPKWIVPTKIANILPFEWVIYTKLAYYTFFPGFIFDTNHSKWMNSWLGSFLITKIYWNIMKKIIIKQFKLDGESMPQERIMQNNYAQCLTGQLMNSRLLNKIKKNGWLKVIYNDEITKYDKAVGKFQLKSGDYLDKKIDVLCCATGFQKNYNFLDKKDYDLLQFEHDGLYLYNQMLSPNLDGIAFIGCELTSYQNIITHFLQAEWLSNNIQKQISIDKNDMQKHTDECKQYKRKYMPFMYCKGSQVQLHLMGYNEMLCKQMNKLNYIKSNIISRWLSPYSAEDFARILSQN